MFLWGRSENHRKWALVGWDLVCTEKLVGGLGLQYPEVSNEVMSAKIQWRWVNYSNESWAQLWHCKYARGWDKRNPIIFAEEISSSNIWNTTLRNMHLTKRRSFWEVRNVELAYFMQDSWKQLPIISNIFHLPALQENLLGRNLMREYSLGFLVIYQGGYKQCGIDGCLNIKYNSSYSSPREYLGQKFDAGKRYVGGGEPG